MRHCPNCGERIDDGIDVCRNCGTARDGSIAGSADAQPADPEGSDAAQRDDLDDASQGAAMPDDRNRGRIVELCSAADVFEALALHNELEQAGIRSRVAGELLGNAPDALPLGQVTAPQIWVWDEDLPRAREIVDAWARQANQEVRISDEEDEPSEVDEEPDEETTSPAADRQSTGLDCVWTVAGLACIAIGIFWAGHHWAALRTYPLRQPKAPWPATKDTFPYTCRRRPRFPCRRNAQRSIIGTRRSMRSTSAKGRTTR